MAERWRRVKGNPDYVISDMGRVASLDRVIHLSDGRTSRKKGKLLKLKRDKDGHLTIRFGLGQPLHYVHVLVLENFVGPRPGPNYDGCHCNGKPWDNKLTNLRWDTRSENSKDALRHGTHTSLVRKKNRSTKSYEHLK